MRLIALAAVAALACTACSKTEEPADVQTAAESPEIPEADRIPGAPAGDFQTPEALVQALYAEETIPTEGPEIARFFAPELAGPMTPTEDGVTVDFDYRINGQDGAADNLQITETAGGPTGGVIETHFTNMGQPMVVTWTVCRQPNGALRIVDVQDKGAEGWDLREILDLPRSQGC